MISIIAAAAAAVVIITIMVQDRHRVSHSPQRKASHQRNALLLQQ